MVHEVPSYSSVQHKVGLPPKANAAFCVPDPPKPLLAVFKFPPAEKEAKISGLLCVNPTLPVASKDPVISTDPVNCASPLASSK